MRRIWALTVTCTVVGVGITRGQSPSVDWTAQRAEVLRHFRALVQMDSSNPPGNEQKVVDYLKEVLAREGIPSQTFAKEPNRPHLVARLKGNGTGRPVLLLAHTDVVPVQRDKWAVDPFGAVLKDGYVWGRGTTDDKDKLTAMLMTLLLAKRTSLPLTRDLIFLAEPAEEADANGVGIRFMTTEHFDAIDAEFAVTEGAGGTIENGHVLIQIATGEKVPRRVRLVASGTSGHSSIPRLDNPVTHLAGAVEKIGNWRTPMRFNATTRTYFETLATLSAPERAAQYRRLLGSSDAAATAESYLAEFEPARYSMLHTSLVPTMFQGGISPNVIPSTAEAMIDVRALPDEDVPALFAEIGRVINDPAVTVVPLPAIRAATAPSSIDSAMYHALERAAARVYPGSTPVPSMETGATDMAQLRAKGVQAYGVGPAMTAEEFTQHGWHSDVERLSETSLYQFVEFVWTAVTDVAVKR